LLKLCPLLLDSSRRFSNRNFNNRCCSWITYKAARILIFLFLQCIHKIILTRSFKIKLIVRRSIKPRSGTIFRMQLHLSKILFVWMLFLSLDFEGINSSTQFIRFNNTRPYKTLQITHATCFQILKYSTYRARLE